MPDAVEPRSVSGRARNSESLDKDADDSAFPFAEDMLQSQETAPEEDLWEAVRQRILSEREARESRKESR